MKIESRSFPGETMIPSRFTCDGDNVSPSLIFSDIPKEAKSLVLVMDDPDAPMGTWVHWLVWNISPKTGFVDENSVPENAIEGMTSFNEAGYGGPCPPSGIHRYFFRLYALDALLELGPEAGLVELEKAMNGHIITKAELIGLYGR